MIPILFILASTSGLISTSRVGPEVIANNRAFIAGLATARIGDLVSPKLYRVSQSIADQLVTEGPRSAFYLLVACALPPEATLVATVGSSEIEFFGEAGLAPEWTSRALSPKGRGWVSACVLARLSGTAVVSVVSMRGRHPALRPNPQECADFSVEEGAFFGDLFGRLDRPIAWFACRGSGDGTALRSRACAIEDPARPGLTMCGFTFVGACTDACHRKGNGYRPCRGGGRAFSQPISTYVGS